LRKELAIIMLVQALGTSNFSSAMTGEQMMVFTVFSLFYIPALPLWACCDPPSGTAACSSPSFYHAIGTLMALAMRVLYWAY